MPLPAPAARRLVHRRVIVCEGYERADGLTDVDARVLDTRTAPVHLQAGTLPPGDPIAPTPEPASLALMGTGITALAGLVRRRKKK